VRPDRCQHRTVEGNSFSSTKKAEGQHRPGGKPVKMSSSQDSAAQDPSPQLPTTSSSAPNEANASSIPPRESTDADMSREPGSTVGPQRGGCKTRSRGLSLYPLALRGAPGDGLVARTWYTETMAGERSGFTQSKPSHPEQAREPVLEEKMTAPAGTRQVSPWIQHLLFIFQNKLHYFCSRLIITAAHGLSSCPR